MSETESGAESDAESGADTPRPLLRIVRGDPSPEELAVLTALVAATSGAEESGPRERRGGWNDPAAQHGPPAFRGPNGWRAAFTPR